MKTLLAALVLVGLGDPALAEPVTVDVARHGDAFVATYHFPKEANGWGFFRSQPAEESKRPWRPDAWAVKTPGVTIERHGNYDVLVAERGQVPRTVEIAVAPFTGHLVADYVPAMRLGEGIALFDGHFSVFETPDVAAADKLPVDLGEQDVPDPGTRVTFAGLGDAQIAGDLDGYRKGASEGAYGLFGVPVATLANGVATVVDPDTPAWLADDIKAWAPRLIDGYSARMGKSALDQATIMMSFEGADHPGVSLNGGALKGLIMMRLSGAELLKPLPDLLPQLHWFVAHEAGHFWLGQTITTDKVADSWITEGGADYLAARMIEQLDPAYDPKPFFNEEIADCAARASNPVMQAGERGDQRAFYACGALFHLVADKFADGTMFDFVKAMRKAHPVGNPVGTDGWLAAFADAGVPAAVTARMRTMLTEGVPDGPKGVADLLDVAGIAHTLTAKGIPQL